jgi:hypothetical protein
MNRHIYRHAESREIQRGKTDEGNHESADRAVITMDYIYGHYLTWIITNHAMILVDPSWQACCSSVSVVLATVSALGPPTASCQEQKRKGVVHHHHHHLIAQTVRTIPTGNACMPATANRVRIRTAPACIMGKNKKYNKDNNNNVNRRPHFTEEKELPEMYRAATVTIAILFTTMYHYGTGSRLCARSSVIDTFTLCNGTASGTVNRKVWQR